MYLLSRLLRHIFKHHISQKAVHAFASACFRHLIADLTRPTQVWNHCFRRKRLLWMIQPYRSLSLVEFEKAPEFSRISFKTSIQFLVVWKLWQSHWKCIKWHHLSGCDNTLIILKIVYCLQEYLVILPLLVVARMGDFFVHRPL
jgi:hypothetical protein